jgi:hypothetical protein
MLSASTLFHFTRKRDSLLSILRHTFWPNFRLERAPIGRSGEHPTNGTPMVCFCDIRLSAVKPHMECYGRYAVGLTKEWGIKNGVTPLLYTHPSSPVSQALHALMERGLRVGVGPVDEGIWNEVARLLNFVKPYEDTPPDTKVGKVTRYYDEREWRWVPQELPESLRYGIDSSEFEHGSPPAAKSELLRQHCRLEFGPNDIRYILVETEAEVVETVEQVLAIKERFSKAEKTLLTTRVLSAERVLGDF